MTQQLKVIGQLITPSWLSGLICVTIGLVVVTGTVAALHYNGSSIQLLQQTEAAKKAAISQNSDSVNTNLNTNWFVSDIPLLLLWGGVGALVYSLLIQTSKLFSWAVDLEHSLNYIHANRQQQLRQALFRFAVRAAILIIWFLYIQFTIHILLPYVVALAYAGSGNLGWPTDAAYLLLAACLTTIASHLHVILLRLILLKPRAFGQAV